MRKAVRFQWVCRIQGLQGSREQILSGKLGRLCGKRVVDLVSRKALADC